MVEMLDALKGKKMKLGMITNGFERFQDNNIKALHISEYFDEILISESEGIKKPDPAIFIRATSRLGVKPEEAVFVGDHPTNDIEASLKVGMKAIWKEDLFYREPVHSTWTIKDLVEICNIMV
jgi:putative hydrolase of the HAD superfamily